MNSLDITNLKFRYPTANDQRWTVDVGSFHLARGEQALLTGPSGGGKSTLLHLIAGLIEPHAGEIDIDGQPLADLRGAPRDVFRGSRIGMIFQTFNLLHGFTAEENVMAALMFADPRAFPRSGHRARARDLLQRLGVDRTEIDPDRLSVGQQQRVAVARAIACNPVLVLADEPTASLDPDTAATAIDLIQRSCREINAALLCVSHDPALVQRFERRASLDELANRDMMTSR